MARTPHNRNSEFGFKAFQLCKGAGIEIGALSSPFDLDAKVEYADTQSESDMRSTLSGFDVPYDLDALVPVTHLLEPPFYAFPDVENASRDFVISSHVMEHHPNPMFFLAECLRVVRSGGHVYVVIPNMERTYDRRRSTTSPQFLLQRFQNLEFSLPRQRALDIACNSLPPHPGFERGGEELADEILANGNGHYHFFTFNPSSTLRSLDLLQSEANFQLVFFSCFGIHIHFALRAL